MRERESSINWQVPANTKYIQLYNPDIFHIFHIYHIFSPSHPSSNLS